MKKMMYMIFLAFFPVLAFAEGALSFAPPPGDYSMVFLGNIFGLVDGVLYGTGSQIMGTMFGVFNAAVLALGGIIIIYTTLVATLNTAHQGEFLGKQWSSIWIPVRSTVGLALLIPKASGYCLMQIFVMWVVVQGVGAADKIWETALGYLNRGGVIIKAERALYTPTEISGNVGNATYQGAYVMLAGQVCMLGLEKQLKNIRQGYLDNKELSPCANPTGNMKTFCQTNVPDFLTTVNFITVEQNTAAPFYVPMPNFDRNSPFRDLNGICGTIEWDKYTGLDVCNGKTGSEKGCGLFSESEANTLSQSRSAALTSMYMELTNLSRAIVNNNPLLERVKQSKNLEDIQPPTGQKNFSPIARGQFGVPYNVKGQICKKYDDVCVNWGPAGGSVTNMVLAGTQFVNAVKAYNSVMNPTLNLSKQLQDTNNAKKSREFITKANQEGWITAGSYFFDLVRLNGLASDTETVDTQNGLNRSKINVTKMDEVCKVAGTFGALCEWLDGKPEKLQPVKAMIRGGEVGEEKLPVVQEPKFTPKDMVVTEGVASATVNAFVQNAAMVRLPGQPGLAAPEFFKLPSFKVETEISKLPEVHEFECGYVFLLGCFGRNVGDFFYNQLLRPIHGFFIDVFGSIIQAIINAFIMIPLTVMSKIFIDGMNLVSQPGANPVVALSKMGEHYINAAGNMWINMLGLSISTAIIPIIGKFIYALLMLGMPLIVAWLSIMLGVGFITAYYIPILPYLIFTFASIGWLIAVIEAMVAAPIVALGVTHPEGHEAFGKGEHAVMILMNVFLRPAMMIIGYISGIALSYVGIWILNVGFGHAIEYIVGFKNTGLDTSFGNIAYDIDQMKKSIETRGGTAGFREGYAETVNKYSLGTGQAYTSWAGIYAFFFAILTYTTAYLLIVQKAFTLIHHLPDKVLRWIGGAPEAIGAETAGWAEESKKAIEGAGKPTSDAQAQISGKLSAGASKAVDKVFSAGAKAGDSGSMESSKSKPPA